MAVDDIRVNGNEHSWGSIILKVGDERFYGFTSISYADARERVKAYGQARHQAARGRSRGKYTVEPVQVTGFKASVQLLRQMLADLGDGESYGDVEFQVVVQYIEADNTTITVELDRCVWVKNSEGAEEGPDPLKEDFELDCMLIRRNGLTLFDNSQDTI